jgi:TolB-like protein/class 3 adenylate cyclase
VTEPRVQRRLAAIAIADVVGYSRMMGRDERGTLETLTQRRKNIVEPVVAAHEGRVVKLLGDGFFLEFGSAVNAVEAALDLQARMAEADAGLPEDRHMRLRIGINLGEVIVDGDDLYGDGVNVAARLEAIAPVGGVAISGSACEQVRGRIHASFEDAGLQALKNIAEPVRMYRVHGNGATTEDASAGAHSAQHAAGNGGAAAAPLDTRPTIAILPFANLGGDPEQGYFSDGVTEDIITELSRWRSLSVRSRSASFRHRGDALDMRQVARELDARYLVEGSVRRMGQRVRITVQLIDAGTGSHLWAEKFDRAADDLFEVQDEVVRTIVSTLVGRVQATDAERARRKPPSSLAAYECVLRGNALPWDTPEGAAEALRLFETAAALDPDYGFAQAMLAAIRYNNWYEDHSGTTRLLDEAEVHARRAVALDENESTCFSMLAWVLLLRRQYDLALQHQQRAIALNPNNQWNCADMGGIQMYLGDPEAALGWFARSREIDPFFDTPWYWRYIGQSHMLQGRFGEALQALDRVSVPTFRVSALSAACHAALGDTARARACVDDCLRLKPDFSVEVYMQKEPFRRPEDTERERALLLAAGLPA